MITLAPDRDQRALRVVVEEPELLMAAIVRGGGTVVYPYGIPGNLAAAGAVPLGSVEIGGQRLIIAAPRENDPPHAAIERAVAGGR